LIDFGARHPVKDIPAIPAVLDQSGFTQHSQLLGDVRLAVAQVCLHMADTMLAIVQNFQNGQPGRMGQRLEDLSLAFKRLGTGNNIRFYEYDSTASDRGGQEGNSLKIPPDHVVVFLPPN